MNWWVAARSALGFLLSIFMFAMEVNAQTNSGNIPLKEVEVAKDAFTLADPIPSWVDPVAIPEGSTAQPLVIRLADTQFLVGSTPVVYVHRALMINNAALLSAAGQLPISFVPQYQRLQVHAIHVLRGQEILDRTTSSTIRFLQRESGLERGVYSGVVTASILVNDLRPGDTLEFSYSLHGQNPVFGGKFVDSTFWDQSHPTLLRRVVLNYPIGRQISWRLLGDGQHRPLAPQESTHDGMRKLRFEEQSLAPVATEERTPSDHLAYRWLQFSEFSGWDDVATWANGLFQGDGVIDDDLRQIVEKLRAKATNEDRVVAALEFVQSEIRYFSVSLGESSHRPAPPNIVLGRRYGDCKDKSFLLMALLNALGIDSRPVLLNLDQRKGLDKSLPSPQMFDHAIVQATVDGRVVYLDPARLGQHGRLSRMGQAHEGSEALLVASETRQLLTISSANVPDLTRSELSETASISKLGAGGQLQVREVWNGVAAEAVRVTTERLPRERIVKSIGDAMERRYPGARLVGEPEIRDDRINNIISLTALYDVPTLAEERDGNWFVRFNPNNLTGTLVTPPSSTRIAPLVISRFPYEATYTFEVKFPEEVSVVSDPKIETVENKYFLYTVATSFRGNVSKTAIDLKTLKDRVEAQDLQKYGEDLRSANTATKGVVIVAKGAVKVAGSGASDTKDFAQSLRDRLQENIDKITDTVKSGKLTGNDLAASYCHRSNTYSHLGQVDEAGRDANEAVKLAPNSRELLACRAETYFHVGAFDKSVADYTRAITLGGTEAASFHYRGISYFYAGRLDDAANDFAKASAAPRYDAQLYNDMWLMWTYRRLGKPIPEAVAKRAAAEPRGDWPRPALAMLSGNLAPDAMLALLDRKTGDDRQMALAEAYFYLGQYYVALGDKTKAREFFEKTRQLGVIIFIEHPAADFELQRLKENN